MNRTLKLALLLLTLHFITLLPAQNESGLKLIEKYLADENIEAADAELWQQIDHFKSENNLDTLVDFPYLIGNVTLAKADQKTAIEKAEKFIEALIASGATDRNLFDAYMNVVPFFDEIGRALRSYELTEKALFHAEKMPDKTEKEIGYVEYNLGASQLTLGDFDKAKTHFRQALAKYHNHPNMPPAELSNAYNAMGAMMWLTSKLDSAKYYYGKAVSALDEMKDDPVKKAYLTGIVQANIGLIQLSQGNTTESIRTIKQAIDNYQLTLNESDDESLKIKAHKYQWRSMSNLATIFNEMGDFQTTHNLLVYVLRQHEKELQPNDPEILHSRTKLAQSYLNLREYDKVVSIIKDVLRQYENAPGDHFYWQAICYFTIAKAYDLQNKIPEAEAAYSKSEAFFEKSLNGEYDRDFLSFLTYKSLFFAKKGDAATALKTANKSYNLSVMIDGENSLMAFIHATNLAEVYYELGDFDKTIEWSEKSFNGLRLGKAGQFQDSLMIELQKPRAILLNAKAKYQLEGNKDEAFLINLLSGLEQAIPFLERRKAINSSAENLNILIAENDELFGFMKQINYDLFEKSKNPKYLNNLLSLHESSLYSRIRARLNKRQSGFSGVPQEILDDELAIKERMSNALSEESEATHLEQVESYFGAADEWEKFLKSLKKDYPQYYKMRFEAIVLPLENIQSKIPDATTVVRYLFVNQTLLALVMSTDKTDMFTLDYDSVKDHILKINDHQSDISISGPLLSELYQQIWAPFESAISTEKVIIIPDKELFNLSFEMLTPESLTSFKEFGEKSLLSKHAIAYNYSILLIEREPQQREFDGNYIAFAPGFFDNMKADYRATLSDSLNLDEQYLSLLPQPFTRDLATNMKRLFGGQAFLNEQSTEASFKLNASRHKIIHIGTHAESDNLSPELSRLVFAKAPGSADTEEDNYLYAYEVYNCDLSSNLTLLTACETGKPGYQPGEGMISMAHAFNYAGSESILTGLWKIDEKSSVEITSHFYLNLAKGMSKNVALQKAKLYYINNAEGRTKGPEYWAGLVLLGDTGPINLKKRSQKWYWMIGVVFFAVGLGFYWRQRSGRFEN